MNVVIYSREDMQPITVVDLPQHILERGAGAGMVRVHVPVKVTNSMMLEALSRPNEVKTTPMTVDLEFHPMRLFDVKSWFITTQDDECAMLLKPDWLPGQRGEINRLNRERREMSQALLKAIVRCLGG